MLHKPPQSKVVEITAVFLRERLRFDNSDTMIGDIRIVDAPDYDFGDFPCSIKGEAKEDELRERGTYRFYGKWQRYTNRRTKETENQFCFVSAVESIPLDRDSVIAYLVAKGKGNGIGRARAVNLVDKFGSDAVRVCREKPMVALAAIRGVKSLKSWSEEDAISLAAALEVDRFREVCHIELMGLLRGRGFPKKTADEAMRKWGNKASEIIKADPYKLMNFRGCGFKRTDAMYLSLGGDPRRMKRQALCVWYSLSSDSSGDTWLPLDQIVTQLNRQIGSSANPIYAVKLAKRARMIDAKLDSEKKIWLSEFKKSRHEQRVAEFVRRAQTADSCQWIDPTRLDSRLSDHQREKLAGVLSGDKQPTIWSLGGSPGTGKTFCGAAVIRELGTQHGWDSIAVCAPTGKAAVRITESLADCKIPLSARTIHSTLGVGLPDESGNWSFQHDEANPLPVRFIVVDESSMIDTGLMSSLLAARGKGTGILFIGDINQLAPVGHGAPLRDMIAAGLPTAELIEIQRNSGRIVQACSAIRDGKRFDFSEKLDEHNGENLFLVSRKPQTDMAQAVLDGMARKGFDRVWGCQVLTAVNRKSELSRKELNKVLQQHLNPNSPIPGSPFRVGDKIVNTKNKFFRALMSDETSEDLQTNEKGEVYVANGELAKVLEVDSGKIVAQLWNPDRTIEIYRSVERNDGQPGGDSDSEESDTGCTFDLGYALSVHKFQGSETPVAIVMLDPYPGAKLVCSREWIYTALSRAKKICICIGAMNDAYSMVSRQSLWKRKTFLKELIQG